MNTQTAQTRVLIAASGTGGHLMPAVQIAKALQRLEPSAQIEFVGSGRALEAKIVDAAGFRRHVLSTSGVKGRGVVGALQFIAGFPRAWFQVRKLIRDFHPSVIVGVGGYVSVLPVLSGWLSGIPTWVHEAELKPGLANNLLCRVASRTSVAFHDARMPSAARIERTGHPIRSDLQSLRGRMPVGEFPRRALILGGSQGADAIDRACVELASVFREKGTEVWHQCRPENVEFVAAGYKEAGVAARVEPFIDNMCEAYAWADFAISRAGAGAVMEIEAVNLPTIFVPYPFAQGNHQSANARTLVLKQKALLVEEGPDFVSRLRQAVGSFFSGGLFSQMAARPADLRSLDAAETIARGVLAIRRS